MRTFVIGGKWCYGKPDYDLWEILSESRYPKLYYTEDDRWRERKLPREHMKRKEIIEYLKATYGKNCDMKVMEFRQNDQEVFIISTPKKILVEEEQ